MELSVIVVSYNAATFLERCLDSVAKHLTDLNHEVCVIDNASSDGSAEFVGRQFPRARLVINPANLGFAAGINAGLCATSGRYVLWLNPDAELLACGIATLLRYMDLHRDVGIVGPQILDPNGSIQLSCRSFPSYGAALFNRYSLMTRLFPGNIFSRRYLQTDWGHHEIRDVDWVSGACLLHRREVVQQIGQLDESFFMYCEDVDFCRRARHVGWAVRYHPGMRVLHHIGGSTRQCSRRMVVERHRSIWRYYTKHFPRSAAKDAVIWVGILARCAGLLLQASIAGNRETRDPLPMPRAKRALDVVLSGIGLIVSAPLWALIAAAIKLDDGGPVFYGQERVGQAGWRFRSWKFRSMVPGAEQRRQAAAGDARVTRVGRLLRATALDELPQLWNIFVGEMSFVGPRALLPEEIEVHGTGESVPLEAIPGSEMRHRVRPGLTGVAQVFAPRDVPRRHKFRYDLLYIRRQSFLLDLRLITLSFWITFRGAWERRERKF